MHRSVQVSCLALALGWGAGCSHAPQGVVSVAPVKGVATMDGKPIPTGQIHFGTTGVPPSVLEIIDGAFVGEAPVGKNQVEIFIYAEGPPNPKYGGERNKTNTTPARYWGPNTVLSATVQPGGANEFKFNIASR